MDRDLINPSVANSLNSDQRTGYYQLYLFIFFKGTVTVPDMTILHGDINKSNHSRWLYLADLKNGGQDLIVDGRQPNSKLIHSLGIIITSQKKQ